MRTYGPNPDHRLKGRTAIHVNGNPDGDDFVVLKFDDGINTSSDSQCDYDDYAYPRDCYDHDYRKLKEQDESHARRL